MKETFDIDDVIKDLEVTHNYSYDEDIEFEGLHATQVISAKKSSRRWTKRIQQKRHKKIQEILDSED